MSDLAYEMGQWEIHRLRNVLAIMLLAARASTSEALVLEFETINDAYRQDMLAALRDPSLRAARPAA